MQFLKRNTVFYPVHAAHFFNIFTTIKTWTETFFSTPHIILITDISTFIPRIFHAQASKIQNTKIGAFHNTVHVLNIHSTFLGTFYYQLLEQVQYETLSYTDPIPSQRQFPEIGGVTSISDGFSSLWQTWFGDSFKHYYKSGKLTSDHHLEVFGGSGSGGRGVKVMVIFTVIVVGLGPPTHRVLS